MVMIDDAIIMLRVCVYVQYVAKKPWGYPGIETYPKIPGHITVRLSVCVCVSLKISPVLDVCTRSNTNKKNWMMENLF